MKLNKIAIIITASLLACMAFAETWGYVTPSWNKQATRPFPETRYAWNALITTGIPQNIALALAPFADERYAINACIVTNGSGAVALAVRLAGGIPLESITNSLGDTYYVYELTNNVHFAALTNALTEAGYSSGGSTNNVDFAATAGIMQFSSSTPESAYVSTTVPDATISNLSVTTSADFTAMPTSADTPDGSDITELVNVDYLDSINEAYAFISSTNNAGTTYAVTTTFQHLGDFTVYETNLVQCTSSNMTVQTDGLYDVYFSISCYGPATSPHFAVCFHTNGVETVIRQRVDTETTDALTSSSGGLMRLSVGDIVDLRIKSDGTDNYDVIGNQFKIVKIRN